MTHTEELVDAIDTIEQLAIGRNFTMTDAEVVNAAIQFMQAKAQVINWDCFGHEICLALKHWRDD